MVSADRLLAQRPLSLLGAPADALSLLTEALTADPVLRRAVVGTADDFRRTAARRAPTEPRGVAPQLDPALAATLRSEIQSRAAAAPTPDMLRAAAMRPVVEPPTTPTVPEGLTVGDRGRAVRRAEAALKRAGFNPGKVDGVFDAQTARAVKRFQAATNNDPSADTSGVIDRRTQSCLDAVNDRITKHHGDLVGAGQQNKRALHAEQELRRLGYDTGKVDGVYDRQTGRAMQAFRKDQRDKNGSALMGHRIERELHQEAARLSHDPRRVRVKPSHERRVMDRRVAAAAAREHADGSVGIGEGTARGKVVKTVQQHLRAAGFDPKHTDGRFDERTRGALEAFQRRSKLPVTGRVDERTWRALSRSTIEAKDGFSPAQRQGERSSAVRHSEQLLKKLGYDPGKADGFYSEATQRAVDKFRKKHHLGDAGGGIGPRVHKAMLKALEAQRGAKQTRLGKRLASSARDVAMSMGGYSSQSLCATGVSRAIARVMGISVPGNGNQIDNNLPRSRFREVHMPLAKALKIPGMVLTWEHTSTPAGRIYGHTAITLGDGHSSASDFIETNTLGGAASRTGLKIFMPIK